MINAADLQHVLNAVQAFKGAGDGMSDAASQTMDDSRLKSIIEQRMTASHQWYGTGKLASQRLDADRLYRGDPFGNELEGRSQVVSRDVAEVVDGLMPSLMRVFMGGERVCKFEPTQPNDADAAEQATDYVNYIFANQNDGFSILFNWFKDALLKRNGIVKVWWQAEDKTTKARYSGLTVEQMALLQQRPDVQIVGVAQYPDPSAQPAVDPMTGMPAPPALLHDVELLVTDRTGQVKVANVAPDEFVIERRCVSLETATFVAHRTRRTKTDLIEEGFDADLVKRIPRGDENEYTQERIERFKSEEATPFVRDDALDDTMAPIWVTHAYLRVDYDGDGVAEWRSVILAGDGNLGGSVILANEECEGHPFCSITPIPEPHKFYGLSITDQIRDIQLVKSTLWRGALDSLYLANAPRLGVVEGQANLDDVLDARPGGVIRMKSPNALFPVPQTVVAPQAFSMIEYMEGVREQRTGVTRYNQGLDANSLNKTATGVGIIANAGQQRIELIARIFAETGVKRMFQKIYELVQKHQDKASVIRLRDKWVQVNPRDWSDKFDVSVSVGLGTGDKGQEVAKIMQTLQIDRGIAQMQGGLQGPLLTAKDVYNKLAKLIEALGWKTVQGYYTDPDTIPPQPPKPSPVEMKMQAEIVGKQADIQLAREKMAAELEMERQRLAAELQMKAAEAELDRQIKLQKMNIDANLRMAQSAPIAGMA